MLSCRHASIPALVLPMGFEPTRQRQRILNQSRIPVPPRKHSVIDIIGFMKPMMSAPSTGFEPATSAVTGRRSNQLSYKDICRLVAGMSQPISRFDGIHIILSLLVMALRFTTAFAYSDNGVLRAFHTTVLTYVPDPRNRIPTASWSLTNLPADRRL